MGWNSEDYQPREESKIAVQRTRVEAYKLITELRKIKHVDKGPVLTRLSEDLYSLLDKIDGQLSR
jgi:hypothetical protein